MDSHCAGIAIPNQRLIRSEEAYWHSRAGDSGDDTAKDFKPDRLSTDLPMLRGQDWVYGIAAAVTEWGVAMR
jgi:hypothetical protein